MYGGTENHKDNNNFIDYKNNFINDFIDLVNKNNTTKLNDEERRLSNIKFRNKIRNLGINYDDFIITDQDDENKRKNMLELVNRDSKILEYEKEIRRK